MTYNEYLSTCTDEFEKAAIILNLARNYNCPNYDTLSSVGKRRVLKEILEQEMDEEIKE